jgi:hypothetical protein
MHQSTSVEFAVDKVAQPAETEPNRCDGSGEVCDHVDGKSTALAEPEQGYDGTEQAAVKRHAAFPHREDLQGILRIVGEVIKQGVADPPAKKDAERREHDHVVDVIGTERQGLRRRRSLDEQIRGREADQVHQPIPTELERTEF